MDTPSCRLRVDETRCRYRTADIGCRLPQQSMGAYSCGICLCRFSRTVEAISNVCFSLLPAFQVSSQIPWMFSTFLALKYQDLFTFALLDRSDRGNVYAMTAFNIFCKQKHRNNVEFRVHGITNLIHISGPLELPLLFLARKAVMLEVPPAAVLPRCFI